MSPTIMKSEEQSKIGLPQPAPAVFIARRDVGHTETMTWQRESRCQNREVLPLMMRMIARGAADWLGGLSEAVAVVDFSKVPFGLSILQVGFRLHHSVLMGNLNFSFSVDIGQNESDSDLTWSKEDVEVNTEDGGEIFNEAIPSIMVKHTFVENFSP
ncbi:hypothetical protein C8F01DRAFT_1093356 [Mycena amicta]|nr:hypothetical protein C8F01DRAFT_1093356 [Mycena amicta]